MSLSTNLHFRQSQSLVMTPQLMQSIRLLQYTPLELLQFIETQVQSNPLLELHDKNAGETFAQDEVAASKTGETATEQDWSGSVDGEMSHIGDMEKSLDVNLENVYPDGEIGPTAKVTERDQNFSANGSSEVFTPGNDIDLDNFAAKAPGMREAMNEQIAMTFKSSANRMIATDLVDHLDDAGYLHADFNEISERLGAGIDEIEAVLERIQQFDPPGMFARNLEECLQIQLKRKDRLDPAMKALVENLELLAKRDFKSLIKICGVGDADLSDMMTEIKALDPKPGTCFETSSAQTVIPDVFVKQTTAGEWHVEMNSETLPKVLVNQSYYATVTRDIEKSSPDYDFMSECLQSANWLCRSLDQRAKTIIKVASEIVRQQDEFLTKGVSYLKPLNLKSVAEEIDMHESTVSRVTSNKYIMTPRGLFELKYFFTVSLAGSEGTDSHSAEAVRHRIKAMIDNETIGKILSDDDIVKALKAENIEIARRTIAKYRESMNIPSSVQRRREKKLLAKNEKLQMSA